MWANIDQAYILDSLKEKNEILKKKRILIAGGTGFLGAAVADTLSLINSTHRLGLDIFILGRSQQKFNDRFKDQTEIKFLLGDLSNLNIPGDKFDYMIHAAQDPAQVVDANNEHSQIARIRAATESFAKWALRDGSKLIYLSSGAANGNPENFYTRTKLESESAISELVKKNNLRALILRCFSFIGPFMPLEGRFAATQLISQAANNTEIVMQGDGKPIRSFMYSADFAIWVIKMMMSSIDHGTYDVGSTEGLSIYELGQKVSKAAGLNPPVFLSKVNTSIGATMVYIPDISRTKSDFNLEDPLPLNVALDRTLTWAKQVLERDDR